MLEDVDAREDARAGTTTEPFERVVDPLAPGGDVGQRPCRVPRCTRKRLFCERAVHRRAGLRIAGVRPFRDRKSYALRAKLAAADHGDERVEHSRVELRPPPVDKHRHCLVEGECRPVDAVGRERVEDIGHSGDPSLERNLLTAQPLRIAGPVEALVMRQRNRGCEVEQVGAGTSEHPVADLCVPLDGGALIVVELARLQ